jgi:hypothetical protein
MGGGGGPGWTALEFSQVSRFRHQGKLQVVEKLRGGEDQCSIAQMMTSSSSLSYKFFINLQVFFPFDIRFFLLFT